MSVVSGHVAYHTNTMATMNNVVAPYCITAVFAWACSLKIGKWPLTRRFTINGYMTI